MKRSFEDNIYAKIFTIAYGFLMTNVLMTVLNLPFFLAINFLAIDARNLPWFMISLIPFGSSFIAGLACINKLWEEREIEPIKDFWCYLKKFWLKGFSYWLIPLVCVTISVVDLLFFADTPLFVWISPLFILLSAMSIGLFLNTTYFQVRNEDQPRKEILRAALYYLLSKWYISLLNLFLFLAMFAVMILRPQFGFILTPSLLMLVMLLNSSHLHRLRTA